MTGTNQMFLALYPQADNFFFYTNDQGWLSPASESIYLFHKQTVQIQIDTCPPQTPGGGSGEEGVPHLSTHTRTSH